VEINGDYTLASPEFLMPANAVHGVDWGTAIADWMQRSAMPLTYRGIPLFVERSRTRNAGHFARAERIETKQRHTLSARAKLKRQISSSKDVMALRAKLHVRTAPA
jgi:hypothetical protein